MRPTAVRPAPPRLTPLRDVVYARDMRGRRVRIGAVSTDGVWAYHRVEDVNTLWEVMVIPTGQPVPLMWSTLRDARTWTGSGDALAKVRDGTAAVAADGASEHRTEARALMGVLDGLLSGHLVMAEPLRRCGQCRGLLTETPDGWRHAAVCRPGCWAPADGLPVQPCLTPERHTYCADLWVQPCAHGRCAEPADPGGQCDHAEEGFCCGCCRRDEAGRP
ncbi:hypothetical protein [Salinispora vitiensis]|uniref:hypothetical protein n=1 Tax=Salinispora vitiensis TaxID=999544 RepID=UPI000366091E|nr:hypothetical protein [Salinispora vitiensis]